MNAVFLFFFVLHAQHESIATNCVLCQFWFINPLRYYRYSLMHLLLFTDTVSTKLNPILDLSTNQNAWSIAQKKPSWLHWKWNRYIHSLVRFGRLFQQTHTHSHTHIRPTNTPFGLGNWKMQKRKQMLKNLHHNSEMGRWIFFSLPLFAESTFVMYIWIA